MKEDFLHYVWKYQKFSNKELRTNESKLIQIFQTGFHNQEQSGPDFFNAKLQIGNQLWAGNVEIHINASDWYTHHHEVDEAYDTVILHVVWNNDTVIYRKDESILPTLSLKNVVLKSSLASYNQLMQRGLKWINCENSFSKVDDSLINLWLERLYFERLEQKSKAIFSLAKELNFDWEATAFCWLAKTFGLNVNGDYFLEIAKSIPFKLLRKYSYDVQLLEALFFGQSNLLEATSDNQYSIKLFKEYEFMQQKHKLLPVTNKPQFFRIRPANFPSMRFAQLASLYAKNSGLFSLLVKSTTKRELQDLLSFEVSEFWKTHYHINAPSKKSAKRLTSKTIDLFIINSIVPLQFAYQGYLGNSDFSQEIWNIMHTLASENNSIVSRFNQLKKGLSKTAIESQALIHLKKKYCDKLACLKCQIGINILKENDTRS